MKPQRWLQHQEACSLQSQPQTSLCSELSWVIFLNLLSFSAPHTPVQPHVDRCWLDKKNSDVLCDSRIYRPASEYSKAFVKQEEEYLPKESAEMTTELKDYL